MALPEKIGRYEIKSRLGVGGMGEVFLGHDTELDREVAIKVMLPEFCCNLERVNRFKLEARAVSAINHPNILTIFEVGNNDGAELFIVTEYVKGETLRDLINREALNPGPALNFAEQIALALNEAHKEGIIHRDIKPENIMVREDGIVKILDFGLAKPTLVESEAETRELVSTRAGVVMGSVGYMSPEQARGKEVDARSDVWSLGVVLYEMLAHKAPFDGETMTDILANIIHKEPLPISEYIADAPPELHRIIKKSLKKDREERYQTVKDFAIDIRNLRRDMEIEHELEVSIIPGRNTAGHSKKGENLTALDRTKTTGELAETKGFSISAGLQNSGGSTTQSGNRKVSMLSVLLLSFIGLFGLSALSYILWQQPKPASVFSDAGVEKLPITGNISEAAFSPDGKYIAYVKGSQGSRVQLILRQFETGSEKDILPIEESRIALSGFSPDSNYLYFRKYIKSSLGAFLLRVPILGGDAKEIAADVDTGVSFSPDGREIVFHRHQLSPSKDDIIIINAEGGAERIILSGSEPYMHPKFSPDGSKIVLSYYDKSRGIGQTAMRLAWMPASGGKPQFIGTSYFSENMDYSWLNDGSGLVVSGLLGEENFKQLYNVSFPGGEISKITKDTNDYVGASLTSDDKKIVAIQSKSVSGIWEFDVASKQAKQISPANSDKKGFWGIDTAPDGKLIITKSDGKNGIDLWSMDPDGSNEKQLTKERGANFVKAIPGDGKYIFFEGIRDGSSDIWRINPDGSGETQITKSRDLMEMIAGITPDDKSLIYQQQPYSGSQSAIVKTDLESGETSEIYKDEKILLRNALLSPDGKSLLIASAPTSFESGTVPQVSLYLMSYDGQKAGAMKVIEKVASGKSYRFSGDSKSIYFTEAGGESSDLWKIDLADSKRSKVTNFNLETIFRFALSRNGKKIYFVRGSVSRDVVLIKTGKT